MPVTTSQPATTALVVGCVSFALFLTSFVGNALTVAVPTFVALYHCPPHVVTLATSGYATALACILLPASLWAKRVGNQHLFKLGLISCTVTTLLIPFAPTVWFLLLGRLLQGAGAALCLSTGMALISEHVKASQRFGAIGLAVCLTYVGVSSALSLSGLIIDHIGYEWLFYGSAVGFALLSLAARKLPPSTLPKVHELRLPRTKITLFALGIGLFLLSLTTLATQPLAPYGLIGAVLIIAFVAQRDCALSARHGLHAAARSAEADGVEPEAQDAEANAQSGARAPLPVIPVHFLGHNRAFLACFLVSVSAYFSVMAEPVLLALFSQFTLGLSASVAGFIVIVQPITIAVVSALTGRLTRYLSGNAVVTLGLIIQTLALSSFVVIDESTTPLGLIVRQLLVGTGFALFSAPNTTLLTFAVGKANLALASSTQQVGRALGQAASLALVSLIVSAVVTAAPDSAIYPTQFAEATVIILALSASCGLLGIAASSWGWFLARTKTETDVPQNAAVELRPAVVAE